MTMHLMRGITTTRTTKRKRPKLTQAKIEKLQVEWRQHNKHMRKIHLHDMQFKTFEDYLDYVHGVYKSPKSTQPRETYVPPTVFRRETLDVPSLNTIPMGVAAKAEPKVYTGTLIKGIATMHKSNAVPIINKEQAMDIARMRRG